MANFEDRPTMDIDFLTKNFSNENEKIIKMIQEIVNINEFIWFEIKDINLITEHKIMGDNRTTYVTEIIRM